MWTDSLISTHSSDLRLTTLDRWLGVKPDSNESSTHAKKNQPHLQPCTTSLFFSVLTLSNTPKQSSAFNPSLSLLQPAWLNWCPSLTALITQPSFEGRERVVNKCGLSEAAALHPEWHSTWLSSTQALFTGPVHRNQHGCIWPDCNSTVNLITAGREQTRGLGGGGWSPSLFCPSSFSSECVHAGGTD